LHFNADDHYFVHFHFIYPHFTFNLSSTILVFILVSIQSKFLLAILQLVYQKLQLGPICFEFFVNQPI